MPASKTKTKRSSTLFKPGQSGNPAGRRKGSKNKATIIKEAIENNMVHHVEGEALNILQKTIELAKDGDTTCIKILMDRLWPATKEKKEKAGVDKSKIVINVQQLEGPTKDVTPTKATITLDKEDIVPEDG